MENLGVILFFLGLACMVIIALVSSATLLWQKLSKKQASTQYQNVLLWVQFLSVLSLLVGLGVCSI